MGIGGNAAVIGALAMAAAGATAGMPRPIRYTLDTLHRHFGGTLVEAKEATTAAIELEGRLLSQPDLCRRIASESRPGLGSLVAGMADPRHRELIRDFYVLWSLDRKRVDVSQLWRAVFGVSSDSANGNRPLGYVANSFGVAYDLEMSESSQPRSLMIPPLLPVFASLRLPPLVLAAAPTLPLLPLLLLVPEMQRFLPHIQVLLDGLIPDAGHQGPLLEY